VLQCLSAWTLYAVIPTEVEFWEASADRVHHRVMYRRDATGTGWRHELFWPWSSRFCLSGDNVELLLIQAI
jgi:pyridoxine/pyridoxamine 5'-phosphate oxidase